MAIQWWAGTYTQPAGPVYMHKVYFVHRTRLAQFVRLGRHTSGGLMRRQNYVLPVRGFRDRRHRHSKRPPFCLQAPDISRTPDHGHGSRLQDSSTELSSLTPAELMPPPSRLPSRRVTVTVPGSGRNASLGRDSDWSPVELYSDGEQPQRKPGPRPRGFCNR